MALNDYVNSSNDVNGFITLASEKGEYNLASELPNSFLTQNILGLDSVFSNLEKNTEEMTLYRGIKYENIWNGIVEAVEHEDGIYQNDAFLSTSSSENVANDFADHGMLRFNIPPSTTRMIDVADILRSGLAMGESEFLLPRGVVLEFKYSEDTIPRSKYINGEMQQSSIPIIDVNIISDNENYGISDDLMNNVPALFYMDVDSKDIIIDKMKTYSDTLKNESDVDLIHNSINIINNIQYMSDFAEDLLFSENVQDDVVNYLIPILDNIKKNYNASLY